MQVNKIDIKNFIKDLIYYKNKNFTNEENDINVFEFKDKDIDLFNLDGDNDSEYSEKESLELSEKDDINYDKIIGFIKAINYLNNYSRIKEGIITDKHIIIFTDLFNIKLFYEKRIEKN